MTLLNLTEKYKEEMDPPFYKRLMMHFQLDTYYASSFSSIEDGFEAQPPRRKDGLTGDLSAYVLMYNLSVRESEFSNIDIMDENDRNLIDKGYDYPLLLLSDGASHRLAYWMAGDSSDYLNDRESYGLVMGCPKVPRVLLQYFHDDDRGWFAIRSMDERDRRLARSKTLTEIINEVCDNISGDSGPSYQPT